MWPYFGDVFGNASSVDHFYGNEAGRAVQQAREEVAGAINAEPEEIVFTSGATEANNLALLGVIEAEAERGGHIITCATEHKAVLDTCRHLEGRGCEVTYLAVDSLGMIDLDDLRRAIRPETAIISLMAANNEIGVLHPLEEVGAIAREHGITFHTDATQALGRVPIDVQSMQIDLLSMSAHKAYGPKGTGALYVRSMAPHVRIAEQIHGGGHERGMRSGTLNVPGIVGMGTAIRLAVQELHDENERVGALRDLLWNMIREGVDGAVLNGHPTDRLSNNLNVAFLGIRSNALIVQVKNEIAVSTGSACTTASVEPSHVLKALGHREDRERCSIRFGLGRFNTSDEIEIAGNAIVKAARRLKSVLAL